jgi:hypothetical protein
MQKHPSGVAECSPQVLRDWARAPSFMRRFRLPLERIGDTARRAVSVVTLAHLLRKLSGRPGHDQGKETSSP